MNLYKITFDSIISTAWAVAKSYGEAERLYPHRVKAIELISRNIKIQAMEDV